MKLRKIDIFHIMFWIMLNIVFNHKTIKSNVNSYLLTQFQINTNTLNSYNNYTYNSIKFKLSTCDWICTDKVDYYKSKQLTQDQATFLFQSIKLGIDTVYQQNFEDLLVGRVTSISRSNLQSTHSTIAQEVVYLQKELKNKTIQIVFVEFKDHYYAKEVKTSGDEQNIVVIVDKSLFLEQYQLYKDKKPFFVEARLAGDMIHEILHGLHYSHPGKTDKEMYGDRGTFINTAEDIIVKNNSK